MDCPKCGLELVNWTNPYGHGEIKSGDTLICHSCKGRWELRLVPVVEELEALARPLRGPQDREGST